MRAEEPVEVIKKKRGRQQPGRWRAEVGARCAGRCGVWRAARGVLARGEQWGRHGMWRAAQNVPVGGEVARGRNRIGLVRVWGR